MRQRIDRTPEVMFIFPILYELSDKNGRAKCEEIIHAIERRAGDQLTDVDWEPLPKSGQIRWKNTVKQAKRWLIHNGCMRPVEEFGEWVLTDEEGPSLCLLLGTGHTVEWTREGGARVVKVGRGLYEPLMRKTEEVGRP